MQEFLPAFAMFPNGGVLLLEAVGKFGQVYVVGHSDDLTLPIAARYSHCIGIGIRLLTQRVPYLHHRRPYQEPPSRLFEALLQQQGVQEFCQIRNLDPQLSASDLR